MSSEDEIKKALENKKAIIGTDRVIKLLKQGLLKKVFVSLNCPKEIKESINYYKSISGVEVVELEKDSEELGVLCKKPFTISVLGILK